MNILLLVALFTEPIITLHTHSILGGNGITTYGVVGTYFLRGPPPWVHVILMLARPLKDPGGFAGTTSTLIHCYSGVLQALNH